MPMVAIVSLLLLGRHCHQIYSVTPILIAAVEIEVQYPKIAQRDWVQQVPQSQHGLAM